MKHPTVFISSDENFARAVIPPGIDFIAKSMIEARHLPFQLPEVLPPWIFFSSREGVRAFFSQVQLIALPKLAAIGEGTGALLKEAGPVIFTGSGQTTAAIAASFAAISAPEKVLFPCAEDSLRTVQQALPGERVIDLVCYRTIARSSEISGADVLVFTSPSNVRAFAERNTLLPSQTVVAMGEATALVLRQLGAGRVVVPGTPTRDALRDTINRVLSGLPVA